MRRTQPQARHSVRTPPPAKWITRPAPRPAPALERSFASDVPPPAAWQDVEDAPDLRWLRSVLGLERG
jgi:hypothetical protein